MSDLVSMTRRRAAWLGVSALLILAGASVTVHEFSNASAQPVATVEAPAVPVVVETIKPQDVRIWSEFSGRLSAVDYAEIRPEVSGRLVQVCFKDGQPVKAGEILFVIDPRPYEAALAKAEANLASARTQADLAKIELDRAAALIKTHAIAQTLYDERANAKRVADASVQVTQAELKQAEIDIDHAYVKAPIGGRLSRAEVTLGNLVQSGPNAPVLTSIVSSDGIYAEFEVDEQTYLKSVRSEANTEAKEHKIPVELTVQGDAERLYKGTIYSFDNRISTASGTIRARARFDNKDGALVPGMFVSVRLAGSAKSEALLIPDRAIGSDQNKKFIYVVGNDGKIAYREVNLGSQALGRRIVLSGVEAGDRVVVDGLQHIAPGAKVEAKEGATPVSANAASAR